MGPCFLFVTGLGALKHEGVFLFGFFGVEVNIELPTEETVKSTKVESSILKYEKSRL